MPSLARLTRFFAPALLPRATAFNGCTRLVGHGLRAQTVGWRITRGVPFSVKMW